MNASRQAEVCVVIAAMNAADTISRAIASALREPAVSEVLVVNDASQDGTAEAASAADDGSGRLQVHTFEVNRGPAAARNHAIAHSQAPLIAILDADDLYLDGRFATLIDGDDWDLVADNIVFVDADEEKAEPSPPNFAAEPRFLGLKDFIEGNISKRGARRGEVGFLKPVIRRSFLDAHKLRYREDLRLGEDYEFYVRALACGARYKIVRSCGYAATIRANSLSSRHRTEDLKRLFQADQAILSTQPLPDDAAAALREHERHIRARYELRQFLDLKAQKGLMAAGLATLARPAALPAVTGGVLADKLEGAFGKPQPAFGAGGTEGSLSFLMPGRVVS
ncbi:glycosyltransferase family 2 protein [Consotaella aegiceratis]|uniref:glycosyltransferase family 2 protein n=1 Tax=Consotaella aegiceratis TaxID=3097961 RepID=UPI002F40248C